LGGKNELDTYRTGEQAEVGDANTKEFRGKRQVFSRATKTKQA